MDKIDFAILHSPVSIEEFANILEFKARITELVSQRTAGTPAASEVCAHVYACDYSACAHSACCLLQINWTMTAAEEEDYFCQEQRELRWELRSKLYLHSMYPGERPGEIEGRDFQYTVDLEFRICRC